jgi:hypothetical protein
MSRRDGCRSKEHIQEGTNPSKKKCEVQSRGHHREMPTYLVLNLLRNLIKLARHVCCCSKLVWGVVAVVLAAALRVVCAVCRQIWALLIVQKQKGDQLQLVFLLVLAN